MQPNDTLKLPFSAYSGSEPSVFVSYAHRDQEHVYCDLSRFHDHGINLWYDEGIRLGAPWRDEVAGAIDRAMVFVFYVSEASLASVSCLQEINYALDHNKPILTVFLTNHPLTPGLRMSLGGVQGIERFRLDYDDFCFKAASGIDALLVEGCTVVKPDVSTQIIQSYGNVDRGVSLAVMPFESLSSDPEHAFLADGITDDVTTTLSRMPHTFVISRNSSRASRERNTDSRKAGQDLGVNYVVEGKVQSSATRIRVTVSLVDCLTGAQLWADKLDRPLADLFDLQDELAASLCAQLQPNLVLAEAARVRSDNVSAWAHFHKGWALWNFNYNEDASAKAVEAFEEAIRIDPAYAPPYAALAIVYANRAGVGWAENPMEEVFKSRAAADKALELAPDLALTEYAAAVLCNAFGDRRQGLEHIQRALELEPCNASMVSLCGLMTASCGDPVKGIALCQNAIQLSPRDPRLHMLFNNLWMAHWVVADWDGVADAAMQSMRIRREGNPWAIVGLILVNVERGENDLAVENAWRLGSFNLTRFMSAAVRKDPSLSSAKQADAIKQWDGLKALGLVE
jgi:TolB-like protein/Flp pilus assembly protein TadD